MYPHLVNSLAADPFVRSPSLGPAFRVGGRVVGDLASDERHRAVVYALTIAVTTGAFVFIWRISRQSVAIALVGACLGWGVAVAIVAAVRRK